MRIASSKRPGRRTPTRAAPPLPAASANNGGRSDGVNNRPQPKAFSAWASTSSNAAATSTPGCRLESGQDIAAQSRAASAASANVTAPEPAPIAQRPRRDRRRRTYAPTSRRYRDSSRIGATDTTTAASGSRGSAAGIGEIGGLAAARDGDTSSAPISPSIALPTRHPPTPRSPPPPTTLRPGRAYSPPLLPDGFEIHHRGDPVEPGAPSVSAAGFLARACFCRPHTP